MAEPLLKASNIVMQFGGLRAVDDVDMEIMPGEIHALIGPNGAGKTTFFNVVSGINTPTSGKIYLDGEDITSLRAYQVTERGIARTFQNILLFENMDIVNNVMVGAHTRTDSSLLGSVFRTAKSRREEKKCYEAAMEVLDFVGMKNMAEQMPGGLPYGQKRILEIARALASQPKIIMLDEPAAGMNTTESEELAKLVYKIRDRGITVLLVEHDMKFVSGIADKITVLDHGQKIAEGDPGPVLSDPIVIEAYLGKDEDTAAVKIAESIIEKDLEEGKELVEKVKTEDAEDPAQAVQEEVQ